VQFGTVGAWVVVARDVNWARRRAWQRDFERARPRAPPPSRPFCELLLLRFLRSSVECKEVEARPLRGSQACSARWRASGAERRRFACAQLEARHAALPPKKRCRFPRARERSRRLHQKRRQLVSCQHRVRARRQATAPRQRCFRVAPVDHSMPCCRQVRLRRKSQEGAVAIRASVSRGVGGGVTTVTYRGCGPGDSYVHIWRLLTKHTSAHVASKRALSSDQSLTEVCDSIRRFHANYVCDTAFGKCGSTRWNVSRMRVLGDVVWLPVWGMRPGMGRSALGLRGPRCW
jgi:hypothetical protein